ncbi:NAD(P)H-binding protein [Nocardia abscessus]|uniref:NAD(P)H-binding protein n=1 Tax=Nocardia abscessus TaxID=120957 RepID=UPI000303CABF|nr:NAD(P)H-binding protein [Nocardia abscessus]
MRCVVFGATGYIGGRLVPELLRAGHTVRVLARTPGKLAEAPWRDRVEVLAGDVTSVADVRAALAGQDVLYYLIHSLTRADFDTVDREAATLVAAEAAQGGLTRIVYLGGIIPGAQRLSRHLASRAEVGEILRGGRGARPGAAGRGDHRLRLGEFRDAALPDRAVADDGHTALGAQPDPADRGA